MCFPYQPDEGRALAQCHGNGSKRRCPGSCRSHSGAPRRKAAVGARRRGVGAAVIREGATRGRGTGISQADYPRREHLERNPHGLGSRGRRVRDPLAGTRHSGPGRSRQAHAPERRPHGPLTRPQRIVVAHGGKSPRDDRDAEREATRDSGHRRVVPRRRQDRNPGLDPDQGRRARAERGGDHARARHSRSGDRVQSLVVPGHRPCHSPPPRAVGRPGISQTGNAAATSRSRRRSSDSPTHRTR